VVGSEDCEPLLKMVSELVQHKISELVKQTLCFVFCRCAGSSSRTASHDVGFFPMSSSYVLTERVRSFVDLQATFVSQTADREVNFPYGRVSSQTSSLTAPDTVVEAGSQTDRITGLRTDPKVPDLLSGHVDLLDRIETQAFACKNGDRWPICRCVGPIVPGMVVVEGQLLVADGVVPSGGGAVSGHFSN
jgi:hypothetical protein